MSDNQDENAETFGVVAAWAINCALKIEEEHGDRAAAFIAEMFWKMAAYGDEMGMAHYKEIARAYFQLTRTHGQPN